MPALTATDAELVTRAAGGQQAAFTALFDRYADRVHDHVARWSRDSVLAADATRAAFAALLRDLDSLHEVQAVLAWLLRTARHHTVAQLRDQRDLPGSRIAAALLAAVPDRTASLEATATSHDTAELVWEVAADLDDRAFTVLDLHVRQELRGPEIAAVLDTTPQDADTLVETVRERMRTVFAAAVLLRLPSRDCARLEALRASTPDPVDLISAQRIGDHAEQCVTCGPRRAHATAPLRVYGALALVRAPVAVRNAIVAAAAEHFGTAPPPRGLRGVLPLGITLVVLLGIIGGTAAALRSTTPEPAAGPPTAAAELVPSPSPEPTPDPTPTATLEALPSASPDPAASPEPSVAPEPTPSPSAPSPTPSPTADPRPSLQPLAVSIDRPLAGELFAATAEDDQGRQAARVAVAATVAGGLEEASVTWTSDWAPDDVLLTTTDGALLLWLSEACTDTSHVLTVTASDEETGAVATDTVEVQVTDTCTPKLTVSIDHPRNEETFQRDPDDNTVTFSVQATSSDEDVTWLWSTDPAYEGPPLEEPRGDLTVVVEDCGSTTSITLIVEVEREADGSTARDERVLDVDCGA